MKRASIRKLEPAVPERLYKALLKGVVSLLEEARRNSVRAVNALMTATYWEVGRRIVESEQGGQERAFYGGSQLERLSQDLGERFGRGFSVDNLENMRRFYLVYKTLGISETPSRKLAKRNSETPSRKSSRPVPARLMAVPDSFPLPWSHYVHLLSIGDAKARAFYEAEALRGGWSVRQLDRQISTLFYERTALSRDKAAMKRNGNGGRSAERSKVEEGIKDPLVLEFLGLKDEYSENTLEEALVDHLEHFLLELGNDFTFVARQKRLRIGSEWYRIDLLFFHRRLRCLVIIDLKVGKFTHADAGQMNLYLNYAREHWAHDEENPPIGLVLCSKGDQAVAHYALGNLSHQVFTAEYRLALPNEKALVKEIEKTRKTLESRKPRLLRPKAPG
jgi:predicted nuclease of restriction endonuclease-like (RecB) superfamily